MGCVVVFCFLWATIAPILGNFIYMEPIIEHGVKKYEVMERSDVTLICEGTGQRRIVNERGQEMPGTYDIELNNSSTSTYDDVNESSMDGVYQVVIKSVTKAHSSIYFCIDQLLIKPIELVVLYNPEPIYPTCNNYMRPYFLEGDVFTLICETEKGNPEVELSILNTNTLIDDFVTNTTRFGMKQSNATLKIDRSMNNSMFQCFSQRKQPPYHGHCSFGPIFVHSHIEAKIVPAEVRTIYGSNITLECRYNIHNAKVYWEFNETIPQENVLYGGQDGRFTLKLINHKIPDVNITCVVEYRRTNVTSAAYVHTERHKSLSTKPTLMTLAHMPQANPLDPFSTKIITPGLLWMLIAITSFVLTISLMFVGSSVYRKKLALQKKLDGQAYYEEIAEDVGPVRKDTFSERATLPFRGHRRARHNDEYSYPGDAIEGGGEDYAEDYAEDVISNSPSLIRISENDENGHSRFADCGEPADEGEYDVPKDCFRAEPKSPLKGFHIQTVATASINTGDIQA